MYRNDLDAVYQRAEALQRELAETRAQKNADAQRVAQLEQSLIAAQQTIARMRGGYMQQPVNPHMLPSNATTVLVLGILSLTICGLLGPIAWHYGNDELRRIDSGMANPLKRGEATAGRILGIIASALLFISMFFLLFLFAAH
jgi:hypothetical protein